MSKIRVVGWLLVMVLLVHSSAALAEFDLSLFKNDSRFKVTEDKMNDTAVIVLADGGSVWGFANNSSSDEAILVDVDIKLTSHELFPHSMIRISVYFIGEEWVSTDSFIVRTEKNRYTFKELNSDRDINQGKSVEHFVVPITDKSLPMIKEIINSSSSVDCRLSGDRYVDIPIAFRDIKNLQALYDTYIAAGGLDQDFSNVNALYPVTVKSMTD